MKRLAVENAMRWTLAACTLCASVFASSAVLHSHPGGKSPHQHEQADPVLNALSHSIAPKALAGGCEGGTYLSDADLHQHGYLLLLGAVKYLPISGSPHGKSPCGWETLIIAVSTAPGLRACSNGAVAGHFELVALADLSGCICLSGQREIPSSSAAPGSLLCDRARHERSGVQLA